MPSHSAGQARDTKWPSSARSTRRIGSPEMCESASRPQGPRSYRVPRIFGEMAELRPRRVRGATCCLRKVGQRHTWCHTDRQGFAYAWQAASRCGAASPPLATSPAPRSVRDGWLRAHRRRRTPGDANSRQRPTVSRPLAGLAEPSRDRKDCRNPEDEPLCVSWERRPGKPCLVWLGPRPPHKAQGFSPESAAQSLC